VIWFDVSPTVAIAVGTAAGMAAVTRMLLTPILFAALLVGPAGVDAVPEAVVAAATAWIVVALLERRRKGQEAAVAEPVPATAGWSRRSPGAGVYRASLRSKSSSRPKRSSMTSSRASMRCSAWSSATPRSWDARETKIDVIAAMKMVTKATP
jgi:hypothetical protein